MACGAGGYNNPLPSGTGPKDDQGQVKGQGPGVGQQAKQVGHKTPAKGRRQGQAGETSFRRESPNIEGRRRRPGAGVHRSDAGLEGRTREAPRRAHRAHCPRCEQSREVEHALLRHRGPGLVPRLPLHHEVHQGGILPRRIAAATPPWRIQAEGSALPRHLRERPVGRGARGELDQAGVKAARGINSVSSYFRWQLPPFFRDQRQ